MTLYRCVPMSANITERQCEINQHRCFSCTGCPGLGAAVTIEEDVVANVKGHCEQCGRDDVSKPSNNSVCFTCYSKNQRAKNMLKPVILESDLCSEPQIIPENIPASTPTATINPLLSSSPAYRVVFPPDLAQLLIERDVQPDHIIDLVRLGLAGELDRR